MQMLARLEAVLRETGCAGSGVATVEPFSETRRHLEERATTGLAGKLRFTYSDPGLATDVRRSYPWARRLLVAAWPYAAAAGGPGPTRAGTGRVARFAVGNQYAGLERSLQAAAGVLRGAGHRAEILIDDNRLVDRAAAVRAGVGWWGKNTMVLAPGHGPWLLLGSVVTDADLLQSKPMVRDCGTCEACLPACPTGALIAPGVLDATRCLAYWTQTPGIIPAELRVAMGDRVYGCDDCLDACPPGVRAAAQRAEAGSGRYEIIELLGSSDRVLLARFPHFYIPRRRSRFLRRNLLVALGNSGGAGALPVAASYASHRDWLLRAHAVWAVGRLAGPWKRPVLERCLAIEDRSEVRVEIAAALEA
jgi:epoxyqueuosine reductase